MKGISKQVTTFFGSEKFLLLFLFFHFITQGTSYSQETTTSLQFLGNAFVKITTSEQKVIYIDPYAIDQSDSADIVLITHEHSDHNNLTRIVQKSSCKIYRPSNSLLDGVYQSFTENNITITAVPAYNRYHSINEGVGFIIEVDGIKIYHAGGTENISEMAELTSQRIDYALYPISPGPEIMTEAAMIVNAEHDIPIHSTVSLDRVPNTSRIERFTSPNKLVLETDQRITLSHQTYRTLLVPQTYSTIQAAINGTQSGDTVLVSEGTYYENINYRGKNIVVASNYIFTKENKSIENTIIDGSQYSNIDSASTVSFLNGEDSTAVLEGFTITGGKGTKYIWPNGNNNQEGAGIILSYSSAIVRNNIIINNIGTPGPGTGVSGGGGISAMYGYPGIYNNLIVSNSARYAAGLVLNWSGGKIRNNIIYHNYGGASFGTDGVMIWESPSDSVSLENNIIVGNVSARDAGGVRIRTASSTDNYSIKNNIIWYNRQVSGAQINGDESYLNYNNIEDYAEGNNISILPDFENESFQLTDGSLLIDAGDPDILYNDLIGGSSDAALLPSKGSLRNDIGAYGGPLSNLLPSVKVEDLIFSRNLLKVDIFDNTAKSAVIGILKLGFEEIKIDSITSIDTSSIKIQANLNNKVISPWGSDSMYISVYFQDDGNHVDTLKIYHNLLNLENPQKIPVEVRKITFTDISDDNIIKEFALAQNYPNPFNPSTNIEYSIPENQLVTLKVFDILGREVAVLVNGEKTKGVHKINLNTSSFSSGVYFYQLKAGSLTKTKKMLLLE